MSCSITVTVARAEGNGDIPITDAFLTWQDGPDHHGPVAVNVDGSLTITLTKSTSALVEATANEFNGGGARAYCNSPLLIQLSLKSNGGGGGGGTPTGPLPTAPTNLEVFVSGTNVTLKWKAGSDSVLFNIQFWGQDFPYGEAIVHVPGGNPASVGQAFEANYNFSSNLGTSSFLILGVDSQGTAGPGTLSDSFTVVEAQAVSGSALTSFLLNRDSTRLYYLDSDGWVHELGWIPSGWEHTGLQSSQGGVPGVLGSALTSFAFHGNSTRLYYLDSSGWVHELGWTSSGWEHTALQSSQDGVPAVSGSSLTSFELIGQGTRLYYLDRSGWAHELGWNNSGWEHTALQSSQGGVPAISGSALTSFAFHGNSTRLYYLDGSGWVHELGWTGSGWEHTALQSSQGGVPAAAGSSLTSFELIGQGTRLYYLDRNGWAHELGWTGSGWEHTELQSSQGGVPAVSGSALTSYALHGDSTRLYYLDGNGWVHELGWTGSGWEHTALESSQGGVPAVSGSSLTSFELSGQDTRLYYLNGRGSAYELGWTGSGWEYTNVSAAVYAVGPIPGQ
jgi:hypothetical protein